MQKKFIRRRDFIKQTSLLTAGLVTIQLPGWSKSISKPGYPLHSKI
ncbi:twin-arginine translocation signal domain-containing protein [Mucilaginibacter sp. NFX135]